MAVSLSQFNCLHVALIFLLTRVGECFQTEPNLCDSSCAGSSSPDLSYQRGVRYTYRYSTTIATALHGSSSGRNGLALDCVVDIDVVSKCHLMMQIRNPQIKRLSPQKEHSVQRLKSLRESLQRARLKFSLQGGKVTALCVQEGEQVWALNIKRALLSMLQTSRTASTQQLEKETDLYGTCTSRYERKGALLLKSRDLTQCQQTRLTNFWPHSVSVTEDTSVQSELRCVQRHRATVMEQVNCTEAVSMAMWSSSAGLVKTQTVSSLMLLRVQPGTPSGTDSLVPGLLTDLQFEDEGGAERPGRARASTLQQASHTVRTLCSLASDPQLVSQEFLQLAFQLRHLTLSQLRTLWQEASFKCRNDWQPLLDALPACGSESCVLLLTDLMRGKEMEEEQAQAYLTAIALTPHPTPQTIQSVNALLGVPELRSKAMLAGSSLVYQLCQRSQTSCSELPEVQTFIQLLEETLKEDYEGERPTQLKLFYALKSVGNTGLCAPAFMPLLNRIMLGQSAALDLRLAAIQAFRRFPCSADRSVLLQLYGSSREDPEVRIAAYQQLMRCPDQDVFQAVKTTLRSETSSQVGSYVWSHLTNVLRSEDPMKQPLIESLPDDIISRDFEAEFMKYSSYSDYSVSSGMGIANVETSLVFSPKSFLPRSANVNLTMYFHGRAHNLLEVEFHVENAESLLKNTFGRQSHDSDGESPAESPKHGQSKTTTRKTRKTEDGPGGEKEMCLSSTSGYLEQARALLFGRKRTQENRPRCWAGVKVFGNEVAVFTCDDLYNQMNQLSLSAAGLAVKLLKGQEVQLSHQGVLMTDELVLPSLSGLPIKLGINMTSLLTLRLKGNVNYRDTSHFSLTGYIKPDAHVGLSVRMGVDGALGRAAVDWVSELTSSTSLDGSVQLQDGRDLRVTLNTPEDLMDIVSVSSRVFQLSGDHREEIRGSKSRVQKTSCTPKTWSKMVGWQLCSNASYPLAASGMSLPPPGPIHLSLRLLKLDRGLHYYLLESAYSLLPQRGTWLPKEASIHLLLSTPQSSIPRDMSLDLAFNPHRLLLRVSHPLKTIHLQGQLEQERNIKSGKLELLIDGVHYYIMGLVDTQAQRTRYHLESKMAADRQPMILSANVTRGPGRKTSFSATVKNVFRETASLSVALERRRDASSRQYSVEAELLLPGVVGTRMLGLMEQKGSLWSSVLRLKYGVGGDARHLGQECYTSQRMKSERDSNLTYVLRADHEFYCSSTAPVNHKIHLRHEESPSHIKSSLDMSYGRHWDEINNKHTLLLSQSFKNQSTINHTSYTLEFGLQVPQKNLNYKTQLLHSHLRRPESESSTHLKIHYNNLMPLVAGLHWKSPAKGTSKKKWEGTFNMDTPWLYIYTAHKLSQQQRHTLQLTSELTASKWLTVRDLVLEGFYRDRGREREARLELYTPSVTYVQAAGWGVVGKKSVKAKGSLRSLWTPLMTTEVSLEASKFSHNLQMSSTCGKHNVSLSAALNTVDKNLKKRQCILKMTLLKPKSPPTELEFEGVIEELRRDKKMYQKTAMLQLRQPLQSFPQTLLLRETFTVDLLRGLYVLESKAALHGMPEVIHTLTMGYRPPSPFVCSALIHPFSSHIIPSDSEICVTVTSNQTQKDIQGKLRVGSKERLTFFGQVQLNPLHSSQQAVNVRANFSHQLELQLPSSAILEGNVCWTPKSNTDFDYQARGKLRVDRQECQLSVQLNGTSGKVGLSSSLTHPFKSKIPKTVEVKAAAEVSAVDGGGSTSVHVRADGKDRVRVGAHILHSLQGGGDRALRLTMNVSQSLLPSATDFHVNMAANMSSDSVSLHGSYTQGQHESLLAQVKGSLRNTQSLQFAVSGDLRHTMVNLAILPPVLALDGVLAQSDNLMEGQLRVRVMETLYRAELRHQEGPSDSLDGADEEGNARKQFNVARYWLCVWTGAEHLCVNVSRRLGDRGTGEVYARLSHSLRPLSATGVPANSSAEVKWAQDGGRMSVQAELEAGPEHLRAEFNGGKVDRGIARWEFSSRLQHQVKALLKRGVLSSMQAKAHYQLETDGLDTGLVLHSESERMVDVLFHVGSKNSTAILEASLWQQMSLLQGLIPNSLQMNCTGDATADRLSAQCYGNVANRPVEVRVFRAYRPHNRLCYGLSLTHSSVSSQAKGCFTSSGQRELRANLTHSSMPLLAYLGVPLKSSLRLLLRPGPQRWALGIELVAGSWLIDLSGGLRLESPGLYGWHGLLEYGTRGVKQKAEVTGRVRLENWCNIWAEVSVAWDSITSSLLVSVRCNGVGKLVWVQVGRDEGAVAHKTSLTIHGQAGKEGLKGSLGLENEQDFFQCLLSVMLKNQKAEIGWSIKHQWASLVAIVPNRIDLQGSGQLSETSLSGSAQVSFNSSSAQINMTANWQPSTSLRFTIQQNLTTQGVPKGLTVSVSTMAGRAEVDVQSDACSVLLLTDQHAGREDRRTTWNFFVHQQQCVSLKTLLPSSISANMSITSSGGSTNLSTVLQADGVQKGSLSLNFTSQRHLSVKALLQHSIETIEVLGVPTHAALILGVSAAHLPAVEFGLELGRCYFRSSLGETKASQTEGELSSYAVNVTNYCPALQGTVLPVSLSLEALLSLVPCQQTVTSTLRADSQDLSLVLSRSCRPPRLSGTFSHSFPGLRTRGVPQTVTAEAVAPVGPEQAGTLFIKSGSCSVRADRVTVSKGGTQWTWALETKCPTLQAHLNGSVWQDPRGIWTATLDTDLEGMRGFLRLNASGAWPELSVEGELSHDIPALQHIPRHGRLRVAARAGKQRYDTEAVVQLEGCGVLASGVVMAQSDLQGALVYHNNCTLIREWGSPDRIQSSGLLVVSQNVAKAQVSMAIDDRELQLALALKKTMVENEASLHLNHSVPPLKKLGLPAVAAVAVNSGSHGNGSYYYLLQGTAGNQKLTQEMTVAKLHETFRVRSHFKHTVSHLKKLGIPANNSFQVEFGANDGKALTLQSQFGGQQAGLKVRMKCLPLTKEMGGNMWHSWTWLQDRGLPLKTEGLCSIQGVFPRFRSRAQLIADGHKLLVSGLNVSVSDGRLALQLSYSPLASNQTGKRHGLDASMTAQVKGPVRSASIDIQRPDWRVHAVGDVGGWGSPGGSKEAKVTLKHTVQGQSSPALQVEAWGRMTEAQLRCSIAVNPELSSSLALIIQGHHLTHSKDMMVKVVQNIPRMLVYLPSQLNVRSQLNQSEASVSALLELLSGRKRLWALGELATIDGGYRQSLELKHSYPQLKPLARTVALRTVYEARDWSYQVQHGAVWGSQEFSLSALYSAPPALDQGNQTLKVKISCIPRQTTLEATLERSLRSRLDSVSLGWMRHGRMEQVGALSSWSGSEELEESRLELTQPFSSTLSRVAVHSLSHRSHREQRSNHQTHLSWSSAVPVNISLSLNKQWQDNTSRGQACALFSTQQMTVSNVKGCLSVGQEGNSYSQNAELRWDNKSVKQGLKYQKGPQGVHSLQLNVALDKVSPAPCPSHTLLTKIQTNMRDRLEHTVLLGLCPPQPTLSWSGSHRVNSGEELFYSQSRLSVTGRPQQCSVTLALNNSTVGQHSNLSLFSESRIGNWSVEVGANALSWPRGSGVQVHARLDRREKIWLNGSLEGRCLQTTAGHINGPGLHEDVTLSACFGENRSLMVDVTRRDGIGSEPDTVGSVYVGSARRRLMLRASGCLESLTALEARIEYLSSQIRNKLSERIKTLQLLLVEFRRQSRDSELLQDLSTVPLHLCQRAEALLGHQGGAGLLAGWHSGALRRMATHSLPRALGLLQHASLLGQHELRRPLATLAGVYQDVKGQRPAVLWRETVSSWTDGLVDVMSALLGNPQLRPLTQSSVAVLSVVLDVAGQHTYHWTEARLAMALSGVRKRLASIYKFSPSECSVAVSVPLPLVHWSRLSEAGLVEILLEEWLLRPLKSLASVRPTAELYRLKRKLMDSPFTHQALLVADQFVVTFDGHVYELPASCPLVLAQDVGAEPSFTLLRTVDSHSLLLIEMNNSTIDIQQDGQVKANCDDAPTHTFHGNNGVSVRSGSNVVQVSNQNGASVSCDLLLKVCSFTLDGWLHGTSTGLFGTNDNEAGNDFPLPDGSQADDMGSFLYSWQMKQGCTEVPAVTEHFPKAATNPASCNFLFSSPDSPLSSCFRVVDPGHFLSVCELSSSKAPCRLASAFVHLCQQNYIPLEVPPQCLRV